MFKNSLESLLPPLYQYRCYRVETAGALKNIIAVGAGALHGLGYGDNAKAAIITRGLAEITRLGVKLGAAIDL